ncbi:chromosome partitioning protein ParA [Vibrio kasasachensis]|uniref:AAA family ATPase n=1 Tax=Vibrio kasasachensis TaxID=2910248 RepID=UPI003D0CD9D8
MLDILESLNKVEKKAREVVHFSCVAFTQSNECQVLIEEAFRFDGMSMPSFVSNTDEEIQSHVRQSDVEIALVELTESSNVTEDMRRISHLLPNHASVIVIGKEDAISTIRNLKEMGFYYLFWPATKSEMLDFVKNVYNNRKSDSGLGKKRDAKKIAVWGCSGGVGTSLITTELATDLSERHHAKCLLVDHDYYAGNIDIFLKLEGFEKKVAAITSVDVDVDATYAHSMTRKVNDMFSLLSLTSAEHSTHELKEYTRSLEHLLSEQNNFIVSDLSKGGQTNSDYQYLVADVDTIVLVCSPAISSVRQLKNMTEFLSLKAPSSRQIIVLNHVQPEKATVLSKKEVQQFLGCSVNIEIPYDSGLLKHILDGGYLFNSRMPIARSMLMLTSMILGESIDKNKKTSRHWFFGK